MKVQSVHSSAYTCRASNEAGEATLDFDVKVLSVFSGVCIVDLFHSPAPPKIINRPSMLTREAILNHTVQLECQAEGVPSPSVEWKKDGKPLLASSMVELLQNGSVLRLVQVQLDGQVCFVDKSVEKPLSRRLVTRALRRTK